MGWVSGQHIQLALNISSFTYYHVLASLPLSAATDSSWKSLQESVGKEETALAASLTALLLWGFLHSGSSTSTICLLSSGTCKVSALLMVTPSVPTLSYGFTNFCL